MKNAFKPNIGNQAARLAMAGILAVGFAASAPGQSLLVEDGQPRAAIVIAEQPTRMQKLAAEELQKYL